MKIKSLLSLIILGAVVLAGSAMADGLKQFNLGTNTVAGSSATNFNTLPSIAIPNDIDVTIQVSSKSTASDTSNKIFVFNGSVDNVIWTTNVLAITYASTGTGTASAITNLPAGYRYPYLQLFYTTNASGSVRATNLAAKIWTK